MLLSSNVVAVLLLDGVLAFLIWMIVTVVWNNIVRAELKVRKKATWAVLLGVVVAIANALVIARLLSLQ